MLTMVSGRISGLIGYRATLENQVQVLIGAEQSILGELSAYTANTLIGAAILFRAIPYIPL